jgi:hypothetical protein
MLSIEYIVENIVALPNSVGSISQEEMGTVIKEITAFIQTPIEKEK